MNTVYTTETPIIATHGYCFDYPSKRSAYRDACHAMLSLNQAAKSMPDNYRWYIYRLKNRLIETLYRQGYCVQAVLDNTRMYCLKFRIEGKIFEWHMPEKTVTWPIKEIWTGVNFVWREDNSTPTWPLAECIALLEWLLDTK